MFGGLTGEELELSPDGVGVGAGVQDAADTTQMTDRQRSDVAAAVRVVKLVERLQALAEFEEVHGSNGARRPGW
ncbi:hypothetical protein [Streptomyces sp. NPDC055036]